MKTDRNREMTLSDATVLRADVYAPDDGEPAPVILQRAPYNKDWYAQVGRAFTDAGFVFVAQDVRGQNASDGVWDPYVHEADDGAEAVAWAAGLPESNGEVILYGTSYTATTALWAATRRPKALRAVIAGETPADYYDQWFYPGGVFAQAFAQTWLLKSVARSTAATAERAALIDSLYADIAPVYAHRPLTTTPAVADEPYYQEWLAHPKRDEYWESRSLRPRLPLIDVPVLFIGGWFDVFIAGVAEAFNLVKDASLLIGPWSHNMWGRQMNGFDFGETAEFNLQAEVIAFLRGERAGQRVRYFQLGEGTWHTDTAWPPAGSRELTVELPGGPTTVHHDPDHPVPVAGGHSCCYQPQSPMGPADQREIEALPDVAVFTTDPLTEPLRLAGPLAVEVDVACDAPSFDVAVVLTDVHPDGTSVNLSEGIARRDGADAAGAVRVELLPVAATLPAGHALRVDLAGAHYPTFAAHPEPSTQTYARVRVLGLTT